jgi:cytoskeletal protein CcmA (bactofilin family)
MTSSRRDARTVTDFRTAELRGPEGRGGMPEQRPMPEGRPMMDARAAEPRGGADAEMRKLTVGRDIVLQGEIRACQKLVVEGTVEAQLTGCRTVEIAQSGLFKGSAQIETADISGRFEGDITVTSRLIVRSTGRIVGSIQYGQIEIERGGVVSGHVEVLPSDATSGAGWAAQDQAGQHAEAAVI